MSTVARESGAQRIKWDEIKSVVCEIFSVCDSRSGPLLARYAWEELTAVGQTHYETDLERSEAIIRLLAFGAYYREFCVYAFDEGSVGDWREWITSGLIGDCPLLDVSIIGEPAQSDAAENDLLEDAHSLSEALQQIVQGECHNVVALLRERWGPARFFASLYATWNWEAGEYPLTEEAIGEIADYDLTDSKQRAWAWVDDDGALD
jgi:hypothetical protein